METFMSLNIDQVIAYSKSSLLTNTTTESPTGLHIASPAVFNKVHTYFIHSMATNTWGMLFAIPGAFNVTPGSIYWFDNSLSTSIQLLDVMLKAHATGNLKSVYMTDGSVYDPATTTDFTSVAATGTVAIHIYKVGITYKVRITNEAGYGWDPSANTFTVNPASLSIAFTPKPFTHSPTTVLSYATPATSRCWFPPTGITGGVATSSYSSTVSLPFITTESASALNANVISPLLSTLPVKVSYNVYRTTDTSALVFPLPVAHALTYPSEFNNIQYLPVFLGASPPSSGRLPPIMVKLEAIQSDDIATLAALTSSWIDIVLDNTYHASLASGVSTPTIVVDKTILNNIGVETSPSDGSITYSTPAYVYIPGKLYPVMSLRMTKLSHTYVEISTPVVLSPPGIEHNYVYKSGSSQPGIFFSSTVYSFPVKNQYGYSAIQKGFEFDTSITSYRLSFRALSALPSTTLQSNLATMSFKVGVYECAPPDLRVKYRNPGYAPDLRADEPVPFWYIELSKLHDTIQVTSHIPDSTSVPFLGKTIELPNLSGQYIDWLTGTLIDLVVVKSTVPGVATLSVYVGNYKAATFTVPWTLLGHIVYFGTNSGSYTGATNMFTTSVVYEEVNVTGARAGTLVPPPPTLHDPIQVMSYLTTTSIDSNPYCIYLYKRGSVADLYIPRLTGVSPERPTSFMVIRNFPYTSGPIYDKIVKQAWNGQLLHSYMIATTDTLQFPPTGTGIGILYSMVPTDDPSFPVTLYTDTNWGTSIGTFTAEVVSTPITYGYNPYPNSGIDLLSTFTGGYPMYPTRLQVESTQVTLEGNTSTGEGSAIALAFSSKSDTSWSLQFTRNSNGVYLEDGYFDIIISPAKLTHQFLYNVDSGNLDIRPFPHIPSVRLRFLSESDLPSVTMSDLAEFEYGDTIPLVATNTYSTFDGSKVITVALEKAGTTSILYLYEGNTAIAVGYLPMQFPQSGNVAFSHRNGGTSYEEIGYTKFVSGKAWLQSTQKPLILAPVVNDSSSTVVVNEAEVYMLATQYKSAYVDLYIHSRGAPATVTVTIGKGTRIIILRNKVIPADSTWVQSAVYISTGDTIVVTSTSTVNVRVATVAELK